MFEVGDKVVYPMHGAGVIEAIEEKEVLGDKRRYYIMKMPCGDMRVMVPMDNIEEMGLRSIVDTDGVNQVFTILGGEMSTMSDNWNRRYRANMDKIRTGSIFEVAEVVRNLSLRDKERGLSTGEKRMLDNARQILISELVLVKEEDEEALMDQIDDMFA